MLKRILASKLKFIISKRFNHECIATMHKHESMECRKKFKLLISHLPETQYSVLDNGVIIATEERDCIFACFGLFLDSGSRYEHSRDNGIAHYFEHLACSSTHAQALAELGARLHSRTTRETVIYWVECLTHQVPVAIKLLFNAVLSPYSKMDIDNIRPTVFQRFTKYQNNQSGLLDDYLHATAFQGTPLAQTVMGTTNNMALVNESSVCRFLETQIKSNRIVLASAGGVSHEMMANYASCFLGCLQPAACFDIDTYRYTGSEVRYRDDHIPRAHVAIAVEGPSFCEIDRLSMDIAASAIGGWDPSQGGGKHSAHFMTNTSFEKYCQAYRIININYRDTGLWGIHFLAPSLELEDVLLIVQNLMMNMCSTLSENEVERACEEFKTKYLKQISNVEGACLDIGYWALMVGCRPHPTTVLQQIDKISASSVRRACTKYLYDKCPAIAAFGPTEGLPEYTRIRAGMYWIRL